MEASAGFARHGVARKWCQHYGFPSQLACSFSLYGRDCSFELVKEYVRRGDYFINVWLSKNDDPDNMTYVYSREDVEACPLELELVSWMLEQDIESKSFNMGQTVAAMVPKA